MPRKPSTQPTEVELDILGALWDLGPSTIRQVHRSLTAAGAGAGAETSAAAGAGRALPARRETGYSTTLKMMQVMRDKGLLVRDGTTRPQRYRPAAPAEQTQLQLLDHLVQKAFGGSARRLLQRAVEARRVSADELAEMQRVIEQIGAADACDGDRGGDRSGNQAGDDRGAGGEEAGRGDGEQQGAGAVRAGDADRNASREGPAEGAVR